jgi:hypothetical protein
VSSLARSCLPAAARTAAVENSFGVEEGFSQR